jgi:DNA-binding CsgD family transcriptional regulator
MKASSHCRKARQSYAHRAWEQAYQGFTRADHAAPLAGEDLELLAICAYLTGRDADCLKDYERAYQAYVGARADVRAARCAFWLGLTLLFRGETGAATGWIGRARRLVERIPCAEQGYLLLPKVEQLLAAGDFETAYATAAAAAQVGERFADADLTACARHLQGRSLMHQGRITPGLSLLDETMVAVTAGEVSPIMAGLLYCSVVEACQRFYALTRAREWTAALAQWCENQPDMVAFTGTCLVHRAEILQLGGAWQEAVDEARRACKRLSQGTDLNAPGAAFYQEAEVHRLRGEFAAAENAYRKASERGREPQPGLALLRLRQGRTAAAAAAMRRVVAAAAEPGQRTTLLPAYVEIMLAAGDVAAARSASRELHETARRTDSEVLHAIADQAQGAVELAEGNALAAIGLLRPALQLWQQCEAPYHAARVRVLLALACRDLGDDEGARLELDAARFVFAKLGAAPELARVDQLSRTAPPGHPQGLTARELQVLRLLALGKTNKAIAAGLGLSEKTVHRHVSNIFVKLDVPSRAAATAYAYQHSLM